MSMRSTRCLSRLTLTPSIEQPIDSGKTEKNNGHEYITRERPESRTARHEIAPDRAAPRMGGRARADAGEGKGLHARPRRAGCRTPADAMDGRGKGLCVRRA